MKHNEDGRVAEDKVARYLESLGYKILDKNWKTKWCEIDLVAEKNGIIHFVEVKYRSRPDQGSGFDYITSAKQRQMSHAADLWVNKSRWSGEYVLAAAEVSGPDFEIEYLEQI